MRHHPTPDRGTLRLALFTSGAWALCLAGSYLLGYRGRLPAEFVALLLPAPWGTRIFSMHQPWPLVLAALGTLAVGACVWALARVLSSRRGEAGGRLGFASSWICVAMAGVLVTGLMLLGNLIGSWPPARLAWIFQDMPATLATAAYWGLLWGWVPVLLARLGRRSSSQAARPRPAAGFLPVLAGAVLLVVLAGSVVLARQATLAANQLPPEPVTEPSPSPVVYGSPEVSAAQVEAGENWCSGEAVTISWGQGEAATGHRALAVELENTSGTSCVLESYPDVAFDDTEGWAMDVLLVRGGSFMTDDPGVETLTLGPGDHAVAHLGWNAMAAAGDTAVGTMLVAPYPGAERQAAPAALDIVNGGAVAVTAWQAGDPAAEQ